MKLMDREKVISNLQGVYEYLRHFENTAKMGEWVSDALALLKEQEHKDKIFHALEDDWKRLNELLKEQEAVEPILIREGRNKNYNDYVCPRCDNEVVYEQNYCSECGVRFLWEGR